MVRLFMKQNFIFISLKFFNKYFIHIITFILIKNINLFSNKILMVWGKAKTESDGAARITLPIAFSNINYSINAMHMGLNAAVCFEDSGYRTGGWIPIRIVNNMSNEQGVNWVLQYIAIGF